MSYRDILRDSRASFRFCYAAKDTGQHVAHEDNRLVETASTIKVLVMAYLLHEVEQRHLSLRTPVKVTRHDVGKNGSGIIQFFYLHKSIELYNLLAMMILVSDNTATNVLVRLLGKENINAYAQTIGLAHTAIIMDFLDFPPEYCMKKNPVARSTAREMTQLMRSLISGDLLAPVHTTMVQALLRNVEPSFVKPQLPISTNPAESIQDFGSKTGWIDDADHMLCLTECGFFRSPTGREYIFSLFLTAQLDSMLSFSSDSENRKIFAKLNRSIYDELENA